MILPKIYNLFKISNKKDIRVFYYFFIIAFVVFFLEFFSTAFLIGILIKLLNDETVIFSNQILNNFEIYLKNLELFEILFYTLIIFLFKNILLVIFRFFQLKYSMEFQKNLSISLLKKILISDLLSVQKDNSAYKFRNIYTEVGWVRKLMLQTADLLTETFIIAGIALTLIFYDPYLVLFSILFFGTSIGIIYFAFYKKNKKWADERLKLGGNLILNIIQSLSSVKEIKIFRKIKKTVEYFDLTYQKYIRNAIIHGIVKSSSKPWVETFTIFFIFLVIYYFSSEGYAQDEIFSKLGIFFICLVRIMPSLLKIYNIIYTINFLENSVNLIKDEIVDDLVYQNEIQKEKENNDQKNIIDIEVKNLTYNYPNSQAQVLDNVNFNFKKGKINTIIGASGSGKTTLLNLLLGLIELTKGEILINNKNFNGKIYESLNVGYVPQDVFLFDDTIKNNISFMEKSDKFIDDKLEKSAKISEIYDFIQSLPDKFDHIIGEKASKISGGQIQRIGLARALFNNPDILILDEFTSSLDLSTEKKLMTTLQKIKNDKLIIIITHREQTIKFSDNVLDLTRKDS
ncbi:ABC transporter ATP-binding protein [Pelagibacterales bacterium SAG-MED38]|nr:ABC transporter ATP-binding protein [Pelagibacterales bacterium SAG-MED38]